MDPSVESPPPWLDLSSGAHARRQGDARRGNRGSQDDVLTAAPVRVLIVDDDVAFLDAAKRALTSGGIPFDVETASTGAAALEILEGGLAPDFVLLDYHLPDVTAPSLLRRLADHPLLRELPVLVVTREARERAREESLGAGAADFASKPSRVQALRELVVEFWETHGSIANDPSD